MNDPHPMGDPSLPLSPAGEQRRRRMLDALLVEVRARRRRRRAFRAAAATAPLLALVAAVVWLRTPPAPAPAPPSRPAPGVPAIASDQHAPPAPAAPASRVEIVRTDPAILQRLRVERPGPAAVARIGDDELLDLLREAGQPTGLIRTRGRVLLASELAPHASGDGPRPRGWHPSAPGPIDGPSMRLLAAAYRLPR